MSTVITAGNATNGLSLSADNAGTFDFKTGTGAGTTAIYVDASQNVGIGTTTPSNTGGFTKTLEVASSFPCITVNSTVVGGRKYRIAAGSQLSFYDETSAAERLQITGTGSVLATSAAGLGYGTGAGGTVTQATSKVTAVTLNKPTGQIVTAASALGAGVLTGFQFNNTLIAATDIILLSISSPASGYQTWVYYTVSGYCFVGLRNNSGGSLSEAVTINFAIIKGVTS
jgi:hypothetical protein